MLLKSFKYFENNSKKVSVWYRSACKLPYVFVKMAVGGRLFKFAWQKILIAAAVQTCCKTPLHKYTTPTERTELLDWCFIYKQIQLLFYSHHILPFTDGCVLFFVLKNFGSF